MDRTFRRTTGLGVPRDVPSNSVILLVLGAIFGAIGLGLVVATVVLVFRTQSFVAKATFAPGTVIALNPETSGTQTLFRPVVRFQTDNGLNVEFKPSTATDPPGFAVGDSVDVLYDPARPASATIRSFFDVWGLPLILGTIGVAFSAVGVVLLTLWGRDWIRQVRYGHDHTARADLAQFGQPIAAPIREVRAEPGDSYRIIAQWLDPVTRSVFVFESDPISYDPAAYLGETIPVLLDPNDPGRYLVDLTSLPARGNPE